MGREILPDVVPEWATLGGQLTSAVDLKVGVGACMPGSG